MTTNLNYLPDFPIRTHHIKSLQAPIGGCYFLSSQPSILLLQKSLCENNKKANSKTSQSTSLNQDKTKNPKTTSRDFQNTLIVSQQQVSKLLTQMIQKGKRVDFLMKQTVSKSLSCSKQEFEKYCLQNPYLKSTSELILNEYFKKRKLGPKLRGLNSDLLIEIENKMFNLIQAEFRIWSAKRQAEHLQSEFYKKAQQIQKNLNKIGQETQVQ